MTQPLSDFGELRTLLDCLCDGTITAAQMQRLEELILEHPEAEAYYVQYLALQADLVRHFVPTRTPTPWEPAGSRHSGEQRGATPPAKRGAPDRPLEGSSPPGRGKWRIRWVAVGLAAVAASFLVALSLWPWERGVTPATDPLAERNDDTVAILLRAPAAVWEASDLPTYPGAALPPGLLRLKSGVAHLEFYSGATVILEGPAEFRLISATEAFCARGKLRATVPPQAQGFSIRAPRVKVVDRGTEFGMLVGAADRTEVHVFRGKVEWFGTGEAAPIRALTTGHGIRIDGTEAQPIQPDSAAFVSAGDLTAQLAAEIQRRHQSWLAASVALRKDPSLQLYYTFQEAQTWSRTLRDQATGQGGPHDGAIVGCSWVQGRWPGKEGLEFKRVSDRVRFQLPGELVSLTLAAWVRVDALPHRFNALMMTDGWYTGAPHWHIGDEGHIALGVQGGRGKGGTNYVTHRVFQPFRLGQWTHLAVVYDGEKERVSHHVDGECVLDEPTRFDTPLRIKDAELGNWNVGTRRNEKRPIRYFSGCMDEFMLFSRALSEQEIKRLYEQGRPPM
jgi:hypothetical protein